MAAEINYAKQIVIEEADSLVNDLQNGNPENLKSQGRAIALLLKMFKPVYMAEFVTVEQCMKRHENDNNKTRIKIGPFAVEGSFSPIIVLGLIIFSGFGGLIYVIGKTQSWW